MKKRKKLSFIVTLILSVGMLAACGKTSDSKSAESKIDANTASGHVATEVNIGYVDGTGSGVLSDTLGVARDYGFLDEEFKAIGVKINWFPMTGAGPSINEAFAGGSLDIAQYGDVPLVNGKANGVDTQLISFSGRNTKASLIAQKDSDIESISDLKGKTVATQKGAFMHKVLIDILKSDGLTINDINFVNVTGTEANTMLETGDVDAVITSSSALVKFVNQGYKIVVDYKDHPEFWQSSGSAARTEFINENPDIIKAYVKALIKAAKYAKDNPDVQAKQFETTGQSKEDFEYLYGDYNYYYSVAPAEGELESFQSVLDFLLDNDLISSDKKFDINEWINSSFYEEAFKELGDEYREIYTDR